MDLLNPKPCIGRWTALHGNEGHVFLNVLGASLLADHYSFLSPLLFPFPDCVLMPLAQILVLHFSIALRSDVTLNV